MESFFTLLILLSSLALFFIFWGGVIGGKHQSANPALLKYWPTPLALLIFSIYLKMSTDCYYLLDFENRAIFYVFNFLMFKNKSVYLEGDNIAAFAVNGVKRSSRSKHSSRTWYEYCLVVIDGDGQTHHLSDFREGTLESYNSKVETLSRKMDCAHFLLPAGHRLIVKQAPNGELGIDSISISEEEMKNFLKIFKYVMVAILVFGMARFFLR